MLSSVLTQLLTSPPDPAGPQPSPSWNVWHSPAPSSSRSARTGTQRTMAGRLDSGPRLCGCYQRLINLCSSPQRGESDVAGAPPVALQQLQASQPAQDPQLFMGPLRLPAWSAAEGKQLTQVPSHNSHSLNPTQLLSAPRFVIWKVGFPHLLPQSLEWVLARVPSSSNWAVCNLGQLPNCKMVSFIKSVNDDLLHLVGEAENTVCSA